MKTIILIYPKVQYEENYPCTWIPYSSLAISESIDSEKYNVIVIDLNYTSIEEYTIIVEKYKNQILTLAFSIMTGGGQIKSALTCCGIAKKLDKKINICFGGPHVNILAEQTIENNNIDDVIVGPGQKAFPIYIDYLEGKCIAEDVPGLISKRENRKLYGKENLLCAEDMIGYDFANFNLKSYIKSDTTIASRILNYISAQGCIYNCRFCYETYYKHKYFGIPVDKVKEDFLYLVNEYNINGIKISDADFFINMDRAKEIMRYLKKLNLKWAASIHPRDIWNNKEILKEIYDTGGTRILMGMESANDYVLKNIVRKNICRTQLWEIAKNVSDNNLIGSYTFIVGFPGETTEQQLETLDFVEKLWGLNPQPETKIHLYLPYPGTSLFKEACALGYNPPNTLEEWSDVSYYSSKMPWIDDKICNAVREFTKLRFQDK